MDEDDEEDEEGEEEEESKDLEDDSLEGPVSRGTRPTRGGVRPPLLEESDNDFWIKNTHSVMSVQIRPSQSSVEICMNYYNPSCCYCNT